MSRSKKYEKNLSNIQSMLDGEFKRKLQVGYSKPEERRKVGDKWTDSDGDQWEQKEGYISSVPRTPSVGIFPHQCIDCKKNCDADKKDKTTFLRMDRCYYCQLNFEVDLKAKGKWEDWVKEQETNRWESWLNEYNLETKEINDKNPFDTKVANALANGEVEMTINKNLK